MNAEPLLHRVAQALGHARLEAVLIGKTNLQKLKAFAGELGATVLRPYYPASDLYRVVQDDLGLQADFLVVIHGVRSFEALRSRAVTLTLGDAKLSVASLADIVSSKRAAGRPKDTLSWRSWRQRSMKRRKQPTREERLEALARESERALREQIRRLLALPMEKRMNFLRVRVGRGTAL